MKNHSINFKAIFALTVGAILSIFSPASAATVTWDADAATASQTDGLGVWLTANQWWNGTSNVTWTSGDDAVFGNGGTGGAVTLASPTTIGSLTFNSFSGTYTIGTNTSTITLNNGITMNSGAGAATILSPITLGGAQSWINNDDSLLTIGTGAVSNAGFLLTVGGTGNTTVSSVISGAGGLTKTGTGLLTLSGVNTFAGQLTVQNGTLSINTINNNGANGTLGNNALSVILGNTGAQTGTLQYTGATASSTKTFTMATGGTGGFNVSTSGQTLTLTGKLYGSGDLLKTGAGDLTLGGNNNRLNNPFSGMTRVTAGRINVLAPGMLQNSPYDTTGASATVGLNVTTMTGNGEDMGVVLGGLSGSVNLSPTVMPGYGTGRNQLILNPQAGTSVTYGGVLPDGATAGTQLVKMGPGTQTFTGTNTYSGATNIYAGTLALSGASGTALNSAFTVRGGTLALDNSSAWADRLTNGTALSLGSLTLTSFNGAGVQSEAVGATTFAVGGKVTINNGATVGDQTTLALGAVTRSAGAAIDFVGTGLGTLGGGVDSPNVTSSALPANTNLILPWATVGGTQWAENNTNSIRAYSGTFVDPTVAASSATSNAQLTGTGAIASAKSFNSLNVVASGAGQSLNLSASVGNLTLTSGAILKSGTDAYTISSSGSPTLGNITAGTELIAHVDGGALTISAPLNAAIVGLAKGGTGNLILAGTRASSLSGATSIAGGQLEFQGATTSISNVSGAGGITINLNAGQTFSFAGTNTFSGPVILKGGYLSSQALGLLTSANMNTLYGVYAQGGVGFMGNQNNVEITGNGILNVYYGVAPLLGSGPGQWQVTGGTSGFTTSSSGGGGVTFNQDSSFEVVWGSQFFKPDVLVLNDPVGSPAGSVTMFNRFDLNGATRFVTTNSPTQPGVFSNIIRDNTGGTAGLTKLGVGELQLSGTNTYIGATTISAGILTANTLANGGVASALGASGNAASNLLLGNATTLRYTGGAASTDRSFTINGTAAGHGASLDASGSGAVNFTNTASPAYGTVDQARTLTLTGTYAAGNNSLAANIADNGTGAVSLTKTGAGLWVLSGNSTYTGATTISAGTLSVGASSNLGDASSNLVLNGGTLQITGTGLTNFASLGRTNPVTFSSGAAVGLDINNAANVFTPDQTFNQGTGGLSKAGAGTLAINSAHTYTGQTTVSAGTLRLDDNGVISPAAMNISGGTFALNRSATATLGSTIPAIIGGAGSLANIGAGNLVLNAPTYHTGNTTATVGNITLSHTRAIQNSALDTTGAGSFTLSGTGSTTPTFGGLANSGTARDLASVIDSSYASVTSLTLNPQSGITSTYGGVIANGASDMTLTKTGTGTQVLQGANTYSGATTIRNGTLTLSGAAGSILNSAITLQGGALTLTNATGQSAVNRVSNSATITANGGTITWTNPTGDNTANWAETLGALSLGTGQTNIVSTNAVNAARTQILTLGSGSLTHASANTSAITFSGTSLGTTADDNNILITDQTGTAANQIIGSWATYGTTAAAQTDYAAYNITAGTANTRGIQGAGITASAETAWTTAANTYTLSGATTLTATRTINALRYSGSAQTLALGANNLETYGLLNGGSGLLTVSGTGALTTPTGGGNLFVTTGNNAITVSAPINDNTGAVTLVKSGSNTLTLSGTNNYSGGTVLNSGTLTTTTPNTNLGTGTVSVNGPVTWNFGTTGSSRALTINDGAYLSITGTSGQSFSGVLSGNGTINQTGSIGITFSNSSNTFTGPINIAYALSFASLGDSTNPINIGGANNWTWTGGEKTFALRPFTSSAAGNIPISNNGTGALTIQQPLAFSGAAGARTLSLGGTYTANTNQFTNNITDGPGSVVGLTKGSGNNRWALSGTNTYTGATTMSYGDDTGILIFQGMQALSSYTSLNQNQPGQNTRAGIMRFLDDSATPASRSTVNLNFSNTEGVATSDLRHWIRAFVGNNSTANLGTSASTQTGSTIRLGNLNLTEGATASTGGGLWLSGANSYGLQIADVNITLQTATADNFQASLRADNPMTVTGTVRQSNDAAAGSNTRLQLEGDAQGSLISGNVMDSAGGRVMSISKAGIGSWTLSGTNTYTGTTTLSGGTLSINSIGNVNGGSSALGNPSSAANGTIAIGSTTTAATLVYTGSTATTNRVINLAGTTGGATLDQSGSGLLKFTSALTATGAGSKTLTLQGSTNGTGEIAAAIVDNSGTHKTSVVKGGTGAWTLSGTNTNTGTTTINGGILQLAKQVSLYNNATLSWTAANINVKSGGTLAFNVGGTGEFTTANLTTLLTNLAASSSATNGMNTGSNFGFDTTNASGGTFTIADVIANSTGGSGGARGLTKLGTNTLTLTGTNTYTGATTINGGILQLSGSGSINGSNVTVNAGSFVNNSSVAYSGILTLNNASLGGGTIDGSITYSGGGAVSGSSSVTGSVGTSSGSFEIQSGANLTVGSGLNVSGTAGLVIASTASVTGSLNYTSSVNSTIDGAIAGNGQTLTLNNASAKLTLSGTNTYTGATTIDAGALVVNGNISSSSLTSVASGATIGGSGTVGDLTVSSGGFINPGNSPGILNVSGDYTQAGLYTAEITGLTAGTEHDQINVTGSVDITGGSLTALFTAGTYAANDLIFILLNDGEDAITGTYSGFAQGATVIEYDGFDWKISYTANFTGSTNSFTGGNDIALMAIPEPKAALLGGLGILLLLRRRR